MLGPMSENTTMCAPCRAMKDKLQGQPGITGPGHSGLEPSGGIQRFGGHGRNADEQPFVCRDCGTRWTHETGNYGYGWIGGWPPVEA